MYMGKRIIRNECRDGLSYYTIETNRFCGIPVKWHQICKYDKDYLCFRSKKYWTEDDAREALGLSKERDEVINKQIVLEI